MVNRLKEMVTRIVTCIDEGDNTGAMQAIARFTLLFDEFIQINKGYIFQREITNLNSCLILMMEHIERNDLRGLKEVLVTEFVAYLNDWDFGNKPLN